MEDQPPEGLHANSLGQNLTNVQFLILNSYRMGIENCTLVRLPLFLLAKLDGIKDLQASLTRKAAQF
jgi:hypothetical protein